MEGHNSAPIPGKMSQSRGILISVEGGTRSYTQEHNKRHTWQGFTAHV